MSDWSVESYRCDPFLQPTTIFCPDGSLNVDVIHVVDVLTGLRSLPTGSVQQVVTSIPYYNVRDYQIAGQLGNESNMYAFVEIMRRVFHEVRRVLSSDGTLWLNIGDTYSGGGRGDRAEGSSKQASNRGSGVGKRTTDLPDKNLLLIPARVAIALQDDGWILRDEIIWNKPNPMPFSGTDRTTRAHEMIYMFSKQGEYFYDPAPLKTPIKSHSNKRGVAIPMANARSVWTFPTSSTSVRHYATFPEQLPRRCISAGCPKGGLVLDPFMGSGTTARVARRLGRHFIGFDLSAEYTAAARRLLARPWQPLLFTEMG